MIELYQIRDSQNNGSQRKQKIKLVNHYAVNWLNAYMILSLYDRSCKLICVQL